MNDEQKELDGGDQAYRIHVMANNEVYGKGSLAAELANNNALGRIALQEELGVFNGIESLKYADDLDQPTRDKLISHTREDAAAAYAHARSALITAHETMKLVRRNNRLLISMLVLLIVLVVQCFYLLVLQYT